MASMGLSIDEQKAVERFRTAVVEPSQTKLVILDFWAEWCGPCKALTPVLEKVAAEYADKGVVLSKLNVDEEQFIAAQFQVRSIPTVYAMFQGQPIADLTNARAERTRFGRRGEAHRAWAGHNQHGDCGGDGSDELRLRAEEVPADKGEDADQDDRGDEDLGDAVGEPGDCLAAILECEHLADMRVDLALLPQAQSVFHSSLDVLRPGAAGTTTEDTRQEDERSFRVPLPLSNTS